MEECGESGGEASRKEHDVTLLSNPSSHSHSPPLLSGVVRSQTLRRWSVGMGSEPNIGNVEEDLT